MRCLSISLSLCLSLCWLSVSLSLSLLWLSVSPFLFLPRKVRVDKTREGGV